MSPVTGHPSLSGAEQIARSKVQEAVRELLFSASASTWFQKLSCDVPQKTEALSHFVYLRLVEVVVFRVLGTLSCAFQRQSLVGHLIHPDTVGNRCRTLHRSALLRAGFGSSRGLPSELPSRIHKAIECLLIVEYKDDLELLDAHAKASLDLKHLHKGFSFGLVVDGHAFTTARTAKKDLDARVAENGISVTLLKGCLGGGLCLVKASKCLLRHLADFGSLLLFIFFILGGGAYCE